VGYRGRNLGETAEHSLMGEGARPTNGARVSRLDYFRREPPEACVVHKPVEARADTGRGGPPVRARRGVQCETWVVWESGPTGGLGQMAMGRAGKCSPFFSYFYFMFALFFHASN
jgi:hypothetical protein